MTEGVKIMRALVVYESVHGNTQIIAASIADGLRSTHEVTLVPVAEATPGLVTDADLVVVGGPTHMHGMWHGIRDWLEAVTGGHGITAAAFDTRFNVIPALTGPASHGIARLLRRHGFRLLANPESFLIGQGNTLLDGEASRARQWGAALGTTASHSYAPAGT
jgi:flavodoxin